MSLRKRSNEAHVLFVVAAMIQTWLKPVWQREAAQLLGLSVSETEVGTNLNSIRS